jgi:enoyl-CoA hydratase/carnithine racemase
MAHLDTGTDELLADLTDRVLTITLNRPQARNALSPELMFGLRRTIAEYGDHPDVGALVLTGAGGAFSAGGDVKRMAARKDGEQSAEAKYQDMLARHLETAGVIRSLRIPTVAVIPGPAAGAGLALALSCDMRIMAEGAFVTTGYAKVGLPGDYGVAWMLTRVVGPGLARELMLTCERVTAERALSLRLVNRVATTDTLDDTVQELVAPLANGPRVAYRYIKDNLDDALDIDHATAIDHEAARMLRAQSTADHKEAARAFVEKRAPNFIGE